MDYIETKKFASEYRKELIPILKKMGFNASITTKRGTWGDNKISVLINKVPSNFKVWSDEYISNYKITESAKILKTTIENRLETLFKTKDSIEYSVRFDEKM